MKGREVHKMEDEVTRSDLTLNSTPNHVLADFPASLVTYFSTLWTLSFTLCTSLSFTLCIHHHLIIIQHLPNNLDQHYCHHWHQWLPGV